MMVLIICLKPFHSKLSITMCKVTALLFMRAKCIALNPPPRVGSCFECVFTFCVAQFERDLYGHDDHDDNDDHHDHEDGDDDDDDDSPHALYSQ